VMSSRSMKRARTKTMPTSHLYSSLFNIRDGSPS
jgi:hypothetical protein